MTYPSPLLSLLQTARQADRRARTLAGMFCLLAAVAFALPLRAQFNGPTLPSTTPINRPYTQTTDQALLFPAATDFVLHSGDQISVKIYGAPDYVASVRIGTQGKVQLPLIGLVSIDGLTVLDAETLIAQRLISAGMFRYPEVIIQLTDTPNATVSLVGEVHGVFPIVGPHSLLQVLAAAGTLPPTASHILSIERPGVKDPIVVNLGNDAESAAAANIPILPGDIIIVSRVGVVYILGGFKAQGAVPIQGNSPLTLLQLSAISGGPTKAAKYDDLRLIRTVGTKRTFVKLDIKRIIAGKDPDPYLQPDDILYMPDSVLKTIGQDGVLNLFLTTVSFILQIYTITRVN